MKFEGCIEIFLGIFNKGIFRFILKDRVSVLLYNVILEWIVDFFFRNRFI